MIWVHGAFVGSVEVPMFIGSLREGGSRGEGTRESLGNNEEP